MMLLIGRKPTAEVGHSMDASQYNWFWILYFLENEAPDTMPKMCGWDHTEGEEEEDKEEMRRGPHEIFWDSSGCLIDDEHAKAMAGKIRERIDDPDRKHLHHDQVGGEPGHMRDKLLAFAAFAEASGGIQML